MLDITKAENSSILITKTYGRIDRLIEGSAKNLLKLKAIVEKEPAFMMIVTVTATATGPAYRRSDGIYIVPLNCLRD